MKYLKIELKMFEVTGEKTNNIHWLIDALKTIPSTSIESERALSAAGLFITKLRTRLTAASITFPFRNHIIKRFLNIDYYWAICSFMFCYRL